MMDASGDIDVENLLFNDDELNQEGLQPGLLPSSNDILESSEAVSAPGTIPRIAALSTCGALKRVAWSKQGHIAWISDSGTTVNIKCQRVALRKKKWVDSEVEQLQTTFENATTLAFSPSGADLLVLDHKGRAHVFSMSPICLTRLQYIRDGGLDTGDEFGQAIGVFWLHQDRTDKPKQIVYEARKSQGKWSHEPMRVKPLQPTWLRAVLMISRNGIVSLVYQRPDQQYRRATYSLPIPATAFFTHAAISPNLEGKIIIALFSTDGVLSVFAGELAFPADLKQNPSSETLPSFNITAIETSVPGVPPCVDGVTGVFGSAALPWLLNHFEIVPPTDATPVSSTEPAIKEAPTIYAIFTAFDPTIGAQDNRFLHHSVLKRWAIERDTPKLHPRFDDLQTSNKKTPTSAAKIMVRAVPDTNLAQVATSCQHLDQSGCIAISTRDGRVEIWLAKDMTPIVVEVQPVRISSPAQTALNLPNSFPNLTEAVSPNGLAAASIDAEDKIQILTAFYEGSSNKPQGQDSDQNKPAPTVQMDPTNALDDAAIASYVLAFARSCWGNAASDDVISSIRSSLDPASYHLIVRQLYLTQFRPTDFISEKAKDNQMDKIAQQPLVSKILSFHLALYDAPTKEMPQEWQISRLWAWISINVRYTTTMLYLFHQNIMPRSPPGAQPPQQAIAEALKQPQDPGYVEMICNNIRWAFSLFNFILQTIMEIGDRADCPEMFDPSDFEDMLGDVDGSGKQGLVALLLNSNWSRVFLGTMLRLLRALTNRSAQLPGAVDPKTALGHVLSTVAQCTTEHGFSLNVAEAIVSAKWYADTPKDKEGTQVEDAQIVTDRQIDMMTTGKVPEIYQNVVKRILDECINASDGLRAVGNIQRVKVENAAPDNGYLLLGLDDIAFEKHRPTTRTDHEDGQPDGLVGSDAKRVSGKPERIVYDVHKKVPLFTNGGRTSNGVNGHSAGLMHRLVRRCVRCGSLGDDVEGMNRGWPRNMQQFMARCVCDGHWVLEEFGAGLKA